ILNKTYGFDATTNPEALVAPQASAMAAVIKPLMTGGQTPWALYFIGAGLALVLTLIGIPALAFALGMFIPMHLNAPLVVGGLISWFVSSRSKDQALNKARTDRGTLIASGFIAGGALMGVVSAVIKFAGADLYLKEWASSSAAEWCTIAAYLLIISYFIWHTLKAKKE
ncbi:MAG: OPT/YSL family transporter, partial [Alistipes sp.]|nr:OPT/YSL family transporter [Alistipes sp.]